MLTPSMADHQSVQPRLMRRIPQVPIALQRAYVAIMMDIVARGLVIGSQVDSIIQREVSGYPAGMIISMQVFPQGSAFFVQVTEQGHFIRLPNTTARADLTVRFKHLYHAFLVFAFLEGTAQAFANDRMVIDGDLSAAIRLVRCLNRMEALILPQFVAQRAVKSYPRDLTLRLKLATATHIYRKIAQSYLQRN